MANWEYCPLFYPCLQYCGSSLSRVGLDFQALLLPLFETCGLQLFAANLSGAVDGFNSRLESHKWVPLPAPLMGARGKAVAAAQQQQHAAEGESYSKSVRTPCMTRARAACPSGRPIVTA